MNRLDAITILKMIVAHGNLSIEAKQKAIESLKAWDDVIEELKNKCDCKASRCSSCPFCDYELELRDILRIIQKAFEI